MRATTYPLALSQRCAYISSMDYILNFATGGYSIWVDFALAGALLAVGYVPTRVILRRALKAYPKT